MRRQQHNISYEQLCDNIQLLQENFSPEKSKQLKKLQKKRAKSDKKAAKKF